MTALATVYLRNAILMSADSLELEIDSYETRNVVGTGLAQKLFLIEGTNTGISVSGFSGWGDKSVGEILQDFVALADFSQKTQMEIGRELSEFIGGNYPELQVRFHVGGFDGEGPCVAELKRRPHEPGWEVRRCNLRADGRMANDVLMTCERETRRHVRLHGPDFESLSLEEALRFIDHFYEIEMDVVQRKKNPPDVGAPIDILVIFPGGYWFHAIKNLEDAVLDGGSGNRRAPAVGFPHCVC